eukprot:206297-Prymnesium_polylepis.1
MQQAAHDLAGDEVGVHTAAGLPAAVRACHKSHGWWGVAWKRYRATFFGKTDDDAVVDLPRLQIVLRSLPNASTYAGTLHYGSLSKRRAGELAPRECFGGTLAAALGSYTHHQVCSHTFGPIPFAVGPLIIVSTDVSAFIARRHQPEPWQVISFEDIILGKLLSTHGSINLVDLSRLLGNFNVRDVAGRWRGADGLLAHHARTQADLLRATAAYSRRYPSSMSADDGGASSEPFHCLRWRSMAPEVEALPCCREWNFCVAASTAKSVLEMQRMQHQRARSNIASRAAARAWLDGASRGYCDSTNAGPSDCKLGHKGSFEAATEDSTWELAAQHCLRRCAACARCTFVSVSPVWRDCSWFHRCDGLASGTLEQAVRGFLTGPGLEGAASGGGTRGGLRTQSRRPGRS